MPETRNQVVIIERATGHLETDDERDGICLAVRDALGEKVEIVDMYSHQDPQSRKIFHGSYKPVLQELQLMLLKHLL